MREEFNSNMEWIRPSIEAIIQCAKGNQIDRNGVTYKLYTFRHIRHRAKMT